MEYCYAVPNDELMHYGVKGMHWGIRRYQPYPNGKHGQFLGKGQVRKTIRTMNNNAYTYALASHYKDRSAKRAMKRMMKAEVADTKGKIGKRDRLTKKAQKELKDAEFHNNTMKRAQEAVNESIKRLDQGGWTTSSNDVKTKLIATGKEKVAHLMFVPRLDRARPGAPIGMLWSPTGTVRRYQAFQKPLFEKTKDGRIIASNERAARIAEYSNKRGFTLDLTKDSQGRITTPENALLTKLNANDPLKPAHNTIRIKPPKGYENVKQIPSERQALSTVELKKRKRK